MPGSSVDDDYDSDSGSEFDASETQLGLADGPLEGDDESNPLVSRIGGRAAWLPMRSTPSHDIALCKTCHQEMQLLVQIFAPLEESAYDRCLLVWGCARSKCQRTDASSLRVIRTLKFNSRWAAKLAKQKAKREAREQAQRERRAAEDKAREEQQERAKVNPFGAPANASTAGAGLGGMLFGGASNPFAPAASEVPTEQQDVLKDESDSEDDGEESETERLAEELAIKSDLEAVPASSSWVTSTTKYPALYLNTIPEPSSSSLSNKLTAQEVELLKKASSAAPGEAGNFDETELKGFAKEGYEKMLLDGIDDTFERFVKRVSVEGRQVVRYEFGGEPVPFHARGAVYSMLWPKAGTAQPKAGEHVSVTKSSFKMSTAADRTAEARDYTDSNIPPCPACGSPRVFEAQLMPNLINTLKADTIQAADGSLLSNQGEDTLTDEARRKRDIERALGRALPQAPTGDGEAVKHTGAYLESVTGLIWSTAFVFVCSKDCCIPTSDSDDECWREEFIAAQFEDE